MTDSTPATGGADALPRPVRFDPREEQAPVAMREPRGTVVLLLALDAHREWAADAAVELAAGWSREGRRIVLADLHLESPLLHERLGLENMEGLVDVFLYGASLARSAQKVPGRGFYLISTGTYASDPETIYQHARWPKLVAGFAETDATLVLFAPLGATELGVLGEHVDEVVLLGKAASASALGALLPAGASVGAVLTPPEQHAEEERSGAAGPRTAEGAPSLGGPESGAAASALTGNAEDLPPAGAERFAGSHALGEPEPFGEELPPRQAGGPPAVPSTTEPRSERSELTGAEGSEFEAAPPAAAGSAMPGPPRPRPASEDPRRTGAAAGWGQGEENLDLPPAPQRETRTSRGARLALLLLLLAILLAAAGYLLASYRPDLLPWRGTPETTGGNALAAEPTGSIPEPIAVGDSLPFSVQVKSFASLSAALEQVERDRADVPGGPLFAVPEESDGVLYYKIRAGAFADTVPAAVLLERLVDAGVVDREEASGSWSLIRRTPFSFDLGEFATADEAAALADSLLEAGLPSYTVARPYSDGSRRWQLYGGAFSDPETAAPMREMLMAAGLTPRLMRRSGTPTAVDG